jgi:hypothetical protein
MNHDQRAEVPLAAPASLRVLKAAMEHYRQALRPADYGNLLNHECLDDAEEWLDGVIATMMGENSRRCDHEKAEDARLRTMWAEFRPEPIDPDAPDDAYPF